MSLTKPLAPPEVSIIVPARNEETSLADCLESLLRQSGLPLEIIVVDDHSTDRTHEIASSFSNRGVRLTQAAPLPAGWTGKNNALVTGAKLARGEWLLFTDADTIHLPGSLQRALRDAERHKAAMLSYSPQQIVQSFWEKALMPVIFAELATTYSPSQVNHPNSPAAAANGQYILITRVAYDAAGGHAAIADEILEDVALAHSVKNSGRKIFFRYAADAVRTRMYRNFAQLRDGWTKNLALLFPSPRRLALLRLLEFILVVAGFGIAIVSALQVRRPPAVIALSIGAVLCMIFMARIRRAHFSWKANALALFGLPMFAYLLLRSNRAHRRGRINWKGRTYSGSTADEPISPLASTKLDLSFKANEESRS